MYIACPLTCSGLDTSICPKIAGRSESGITLVITPQTSLGLMLDSMVPRLSEELLDEAHMRPVPDTGAPSCPNPGRCRTEPLSLAARLDDWRIRVDAPEPCTLNLAPPCMERDELPPPAVDGSPLSEEASSGFTPVAMKTRIAPSCWVPPGDVLGALALAPVPP